MPSGSVHGFGPFRLDPDSRVLARDGIAVALAPRTFDLLLVLVASKGRLLSKNELLRAVWGDVNVEEASLSFQISTLRKALGEYGSAWIETVPKHGYRFTAEVKTGATVEPIREPAGSPGTSSQESEPERKRLAIPALRGRRAIWASAFVLSAAGVMIVGWFIRARPPGPNSETPLNVRPLTSYPGQEIQPSLSPDGTQVAFAWDGERKNNPAIYVQLVGQGKPLPLTADPRPEFSPSWSPDGRMIAFCRLVDERQRDVSGSGPGEIVFVLARGGSENVVARPSQTWVPAGDLSFQTLSWFPSSDALAVVGYAASGSQNPGGPSIAHPYAIYVVPLNGGEARRITSPAERTWGDGLPAVSPDGRYLAFTRSSGRKPVSSEVHIVALGGGKLPSGDPLPLMRFSWMPQMTEPFEFQVAGVGWGPGPDEVLFAQGGLWSVPVAGHRVPKLVPTPGYRLGRFSVSRDGALLAFSSGSWDLHIWRLPGPENTLTTKETPAQGEPLIAGATIESNPQYSPDGKRIAFTSLRSGKTQIWASDTDGSNPIQITHSEAWNGTPRWSPDGRYIAYDSIDRGNKSNIYVIPAEGGPARRITPGDSHEDVPSWSRDGRWIYYESDLSGEFQLWKTEFPSGSTVQVTSNGGVAAFESPDGRWIYYGKRERGGIWRKPVERGEEELVIDHGHPLFWGMYDKGVCQLNPFGQDVTIECMAFGSSRLLTVARFPNEGHVRPTGPSFAVSPDGRWILYSRVERAESDLMLIDNFGLLRK